MPNLEVQPGWPAARQLDRDEFASGGPNGNLNEHAKVFLARTEYLQQQKANKSEIVQGIYEFSSYVEFNLKKSTIPSNSSIKINEINPDPNGSWHQGYNHWNGTTLNKSYDQEKNITQSINILTDQKFQDSIKNGIYEIGDLIELTLRQENCINARYSIATTPVESNFHPVLHTMRACYSDPISVVGGTVVRVSAPDGYSIGITQAEVIGGAITYDSGWLEGEKSLKLNAATKYIGFSVRKNDDSVFNLTELNTLNFKIAFSTGSASLITDALSKLKQKRVTERYKAMEFWNGSFDTSTGLIGISYNPRLSRVKALPVVGGTVVKITAPSGYNIAIAQFSELGKPVVVDTGWQSDSIELVLLQNTRYIHTNVRLPNDTNIDLKVLDNQAFTIEYTRRSELVDTSLFGGSNSLNNSRIEFDDLNQAHGGITTFGAPFDSIDAMIHASKIGFKIAETDIVMTADNEFVCMHDTQYNNTYFTNADGSDLASAVNVNSLTLAQAQSQFLQRSNIAKYRKPVQTVDEYFETCFRYGLKPYIEIKQMNISQAERLANKAKKFFAAEDVTFISFDQSHLNALNNFCNFKLGLLSFTSTNAVIDQVKTLGSNFFVGVMQNTLTQAVKDYADSKGVLVSVWTVTSNTQLNSHLKNGVQFMGTDNIPPLNGVNGVIFKSYTSGLNFNDFVLSNASVDGGVLTLQEGGTAEFTFEVGLKNIAFLSDIVGKGNFSLSFWINGNQNEIINVSNALEAQAKLNKLAVSTGFIGILIQAHSLSEIYDFSFKLLNVQV